LYEKARETVARFVRARGPEEILFTRGTTEAINLVAASWGGANLGLGDEIILTVAEHYSSLVPWQLAHSEPARVCAFWTWKMMAA
jgi:cysteine desulfurase/selenocysteine lyase